MNGRYQTYKTVLGNERDAVEICGVCQNGMIEGICAGDESVDVCPECGATEQDTVWVDSDDFIDGTLTRVPCTQMVTK